MAKRIIFTRGNKVIRERKQPTSRPAAPQPTLPPAPAQNNAEIAAAEAALKAVDDRIAELNAKSKELSELRRQNRESGNYSKAENRRLLLQQDSIGAELIRLNRGRNKYVRDVKRAKGIPTSKPIGINPKTGEREKNYIESAIDRGLPAAKERAAQARQRQTRIVNLSEQTGIPQEELRKRGDTDLKILERAVGTATQAKQENIIRDQLPAMGERRSLKVKSGQRITAGDIIPRGGAIDLTKSNQIIGTAQEANRLNTFNVFNTEYKEQRRNELAAQLGSGLQDIRAVTFSAASTSVARQKAEAQRQQRQETTLRATSADVGRIQTGIIGGIDIGGNTTQIEARRNRNRQRAVRGIERFYEVTEQGTFDGQSLDLNVPLTNATVPFPSLRRADVGSRKYLQPALNATVNALKGGGREFVGLTRETFPALFPTYQEGSTKKAVKDAAFNLVGQELSTYQEAGTELAAFLPQNVMRSVRNIGVTPIAASVGTSQNVKSELGRAGFAFLQSYNPLDAKGRANILFTVAAAGVGAGAATKARFSPDPLKNINVEGTQFEPIFQEFSNAPSPKFGVPKKNVPFVVSGRAALANRFGTADLFGISKPSGSSFLTIRSRGKITIVERTAGGQTIVRTMNPRNFKVWNEQIFTDAAKGFDISKLTPATVQARTPLETLNNLQARIYRGRASTYNINEVSGTGFLVQRTRGKVEVGELLRTTTEATPRVRVRNFLEQETFKIEDLVNKKTLARAVAERPSGEPAIKIFNPKFVLEEVPQTVLESRNVNLGAPTQPRGRNVEFFMREQTTPIRSTSVVEGLRFTRFRTRQTTGINPEAIPTFKFNLPSLPRRGGGKRGQFGSGFSPLSLEFAERPRTSQRPQETFLLSAERLTDPLQRTRQVETRVTVPDITLRPQLEIPRLRFSQRNVRVTTQLRESLRLQRNVRTAQPITRNTLTRQEQLATPIRLTDITPIQTNIQLPKQLQTQVQTQIQTPITETPALLTQTPVPPTPPPQFTGFPFSTPAGGSLFVPFVPIIPDVGARSGRKRKTKKGRRPFRPSRGALNIVFGVEGIDPFKTKDITGLLVR